ncbi:hypothetical protein AVEN_104370-1, partial [Araneus ventricosus]
GQGSGFIQMIPCESRPVEKTIKGPCSDHKIIVSVDRLGSPLESLFGVLSAVRASKLLDAERC